MSSLAPGVPMNDRLLSSETAVLLIPSCRLFDQGQLAGSPRSSPSSSKGEEITPGRGHPAPAVFKTGLTWKPPPVTMCIRGGYITIAAVRSALRPRHKVKERSPKLRRNRHRANRDQESGQSGHQEGSKSSQTLVT